MPNCSRLVLWLCPRNAGDANRCEGCVHLAPGWCGCAGLLMDMTHPCFSMNCILVQGFSSFNVHKNHRGTCVKIRLPSPRCSSDSVGPWGTQILYFQGQGGGDSVSQGVWWHYLAVSFGPWSQLKKLTIKDSLAVARTPFSLLLVKEHGCGERISGS